ncbi:DUF6262 family protein [Streptomyces griseorubiginosus]|uniref:DUF6262 family protein n=1 Tax=Streptomyces griseorubiginosus TaxID=67304 RepID=UPI002E802AC1|nr:DUF6262 family protein [Streptomyces griseorubiginosus]WUB50312.1 DUF6262 family protein [Streptomyces griseorubiginosus]
MEAALPGHRPARAPGRVDLLQLLAPRGNPAPLAEARRRDSLDKRTRVLTAITALEKEGQPVTFAAVARTARVSAWLTYAPGVREHIEAAQLRQARLTTIPAQLGNPPTFISLRAELELAREEIKELRTERDRLHDALRHQLGRQLDALHTPDLAAKAEELARQNVHLTSQLQQASAARTAAEKLLSFRR